MLAMLLLLLSVAGPLLLQCWQHAVWLGTALHLLAPDQPLHIIDGPLGVDCGLVLGCVSDQPLSVCISTGKQVHKAGQ